MSPWVTILKVLFITLHFPQPALPPAAFLCFSVRPRKLPCLRQNPHFIILSPGARPSEKKEKKKQMIPLPAEHQWTAYSFTELDSSTFRLFSAALPIMHLHQIKPTQETLNGPFWGSQGH